MSPYHNNGIVLSAFAAFFAVYTSRMKGVKRFFVFVSGALALFTAPLLAFAHEVYVLSPEEIRYGLSTPPFSLWDALRAHLDQFVFWGFIGALLVFSVFLVSVSRVIEAKLDPFLMRIKKYAPTVARVTVGISFIAAAYYHSLFGPELPLAELFGAFALYADWLLAIIGVFLTVGMYVRECAIAAGVLFAVAVYERGAYMLTYTNYFGEIVTLALLGSSVGVREKPHTGWFSRVVERLRPYRFAFLRVAFGVSLLYAAFYAKVFHNILALQVASMPLGHMHSLAYYFGFTPEFLVLGAAIVEILLGTFFLLGIEIRFTALFLEFWLAMSLIYFGEVVWPHIVLIGIPIAFFLYGYDKYSVEGAVFKDGEREPVL